MIPSEFNPKIVIEAKLTEDDGTARDKVTRIQHLHSLSIAGQRGGQQNFEVVACIAGRGFGVRKEDMKKLLLATRGKVFTPKTSIGWSIAPSSKSSGQDDADPAWRRGAAAEFLGRR